MNVKIVFFFDVDFRRVQDRSQDGCLAPRRGPRRPSVKWIRSKGGLFGGVLDQQKFARAQILREILGEF